jgi:hypothetical protein
MRFRIALIIVSLGCLAWPAGTSAQDSPQAKPVTSISKKLGYSWVPDKGPLRGIILNFWAALQPGQEISDPWRSFCEKHGLAWGQTGNDPFQYLADLAAELKRPELVHAPIIWAGLSSGNMEGTLVAQKHPGRMVALVGTAPVAVFIKGNDDFNFGRPKLNGVQPHNSVHDIFHVLGVPVFLQTGENDSICGSAQAYGFCDYGRNKGAPWTYFCLPGAGHGGHKNEVVMPWLEAVMAQRLPADVDLSKGLPKLKAVRAEDGWLGNTRNLEVGAFQSYNGDKKKAAWLPDKTAAEAWKKYGKGMPYEFPDQTKCLPNGLIDKLVVNDTNYNQIIPSDGIHGDGWKIVANLKEGDVGCLTAHRAFCMTVIGKVPALVRGCDWIRPDNLALDFVGASLLEFTVTDNALVYVGHDTKTGKIPTWLADWKDTGEEVLTGYFGTEHRMRLYEKAFEKNARVKLGANKDRDPKTTEWIYLTIAKPQKQK